MINLKPGYRFKGAEDQQIYFDLSGLFMNVDLYLEYEGNYFLFFRVEKDSAIKKYGHWQCSSAHF